MKVRYIKEHINYDFILGKEYEATRYKRGWLMIEGQLYREECFKNIEMVCDICNRMVKPLDAHTGKLEGKLITAHIDCWNKKIDSLEEGLLEGLQSAT